MGLKVSEVGIGGAELVALLDVPVELNCDKEGTDAGNVDNGSKGLKTDEVVDVAVS